MREKNQVVLPLNLGICIPEGDFVFKVAEICESLDYTELFNTYVRKWRKVNPITLFEIVAFGYALPYGQRARPQRTARRRHPLPISLFLPKRSFPSPVFLNVDIVIALGAKL